MIIHYTFMELRSNVNV